MAIMGLAPVNMAIGLITRPSVIAYIVLCSMAIATRVAYIIYDKPFYQFSTVDRPEAARPAGWEVNALGELERAAVNIAREGEIGNIYSNNSGRSAHVSPLYPFLLSGLYMIFGWNTVAGRLSQELCAIAATTLGFALLPIIARASGLSTFAGWATALVLAVLPLNLWLETWGSWEQPYSAVLLLGFLFIFCRLRDEQWKRYSMVFCVAVLLGIAALLSPALLAAGALLMIAEILTPQGQRRRVVVANFVIASIVAVILIPWTVRNYLALGGFIPLRSNFGLELAIGNNPGATGKTFATSFKDTTPRHPFTNAEELEHLLEIGEHAYMQEKLSSALQWMSANPRRTLELIIHRFRLFWFPPADMWPLLSPGRHLKALVFTFIGLAALIELAYLLLTQHEKALLLMAAVVGPSLIYMLTHVDPRYRYPIFSLTSLLAFHLIWSVWESAVHGSTRHKRQNSLNALMKDES